MMEQDDRLEWHVRLNGDEGEIFLWFGEELGRQLMFSYLSMCVVRPGEEERPFSLESVFEIGHDDSARRGRRSF